LTKFHFLIGFKQNKLDFDNQKNRQQRRQKMGMTKVQLQQIFFELKVYKQLFEAVRSWKENFNIHEDDRCHKMHDVLWLAFDNADKKLFPNISKLLSDNETNLLLGQILVAQGKITSLELDEAIRRQRLTNEMIGVVLIKMRLASENDIKIAMEIQEAEKLNLIPDQPASMLFGEILVVKDIISVKQRDCALEYQKEIFFPHHRLGEIMLKWGYILEFHITETLAVQLGLEIVSTDVLMSVSDKIIKLIKPQIAILYRVIPIREKKSGELVVAMIDPTNIEYCDNLANLLERKIKPVLAYPTNISTALSVYYSADSVFVGLMSENEN